MKGSKRTGGFEDTETGFRYDDERGFEGSGPQERYRAEERRQPEEWRERRRGGEDWYQGFPESRGFAHRDWERERDYWNPPSESSFGREREDYGREEYEPADYSYSGPGNVWRSRTRERPEWYRGASSRTGAAEHYRRTPNRFAGVGPQGYRRSDERIAEDINEMLTQDPDIDPTNIVVEVQEGEVTLKGTVSDREAKRRAEDIAESCSGVKEVQNQLRIKREEEPAQRQRIAS